MLVKGGCPTAAVSIPTATLARTCPIWRDAAIDLIAAEQPDLLVVSAWSGYPNTDEEWAAGLAETLARVAPLAPQLVVLGDNPPARDNPAECLSANVRSASDCTATPDRVVATGRIAVEQAAAAASGGRFVDTTSWMCTPTRVPGHHRRHPALPRPHAPLDRCHDVVGAAGRRRSAAGRLNVSRCARGPGARRRRRRSRRRR